MAQRTRVSLARAASSDTSTVKTTNTKTRRPHRKSRNGCAECKKRHIRCDEHQPSCANCEAAERVCSFLTSQAGKQKQKQGPRQRAKQQQSQQRQQPEPAPDPDPTATILTTLEFSSESNGEVIVNADLDHAVLSPLVVPLSNDQPDLDQVLDHLSHTSIPQHDSLSFTKGHSTNPHHIPSPASPLELSNVSTPPADCCPGLSIVPEYMSKAIYIPQHMVLMHYANTVPNFTGPERSVIDIAVRHAIVSPYLLDEVLAFTAFHIASIYPGSATYLRCLATELQNRALASFTQITKVVPSDHKATAVPRFLFSAILGRHVLADALTLCSSDFRFFIDRFVECINLNRGIKSVTPPAWDYLYSTEIQPFLRVVHEAQTKITSPGNECDPLIRVMDNSDLNEASVKACRDAIGVLQWCFDLCQGLDEDNYLQAASVFSVRIEANFVDVLRKHRPEALLILAYYGVLLYRCRNFWAFHDSGATMIRAISDWLGSYWQDSLVWPLYVLETERISEHLTTPSHIST